MGTEKTAIKKKGKDDYKLIWQEALPGLLERNVSLQMRALDIIEEKIDGVSAAQAATIYGILHDKCQMIIGQQADKSATVNMYFGGDIPTADDTSKLMQRVLDRMHGKDSEKKVELEEVEVVDV